MFGLLSAIMTSKDGNVEKRMNNLALIATLKLGISAVIGIGMLLYVFTPILAVLWPVLVAVIFVVAFTKAHLAIKDAIKHRSVGEFIKAFILLIFISAVLGVLFAFFDIIETSRGVSRLATLISILTVFNVGILFIGDKLVSFLRKRKIRRSL